MVRKDNLKKTVSHLSNEIGSRSIHEIISLKRAADYITSELIRFGYEVSEQHYTYDDKRYTNISVEIPGQKDGEGSFVIGAHYDTVMGTPGADDNASGIAGLLELARLMSGKKYEKTVRFVAFTLEEPPAFRTEYMGSYVYAKSMKKKGEKVEGMICLESIGFFTDLPKSQYFPVGFLQWFYPDTGNFIAFVSDFSSKGFLNRVKDAFQEGTDLPVESISTFSLVPGIDFSDHRSFWEFGYKALMVTDTAFYRNAHYHMLSDTPDTLDYERMAKVVQGLYYAIEKLAGAP